MPFVLRQVTPVRLSRLGEPSKNGGVDNCSQMADDDVRQLISNQTLSACLRQLASLVSLASDIFDHCHDEANVLQQRTVQLRQRLDRLQSDADQRLDSRSVAIPEGDLAAFSHDHKTNHFKSGQPPTAPAATPTQVPELKLVTAENRPKALVLLYEKAAALDSSPPVNRPDSLVMLMANGGKGANYLDAADYGRLMELGATLRRSRRKHRTNVLEIETRRPASLAHMREWLTDDEGVLDDLSAPVGPDNRRPIDNDHKDSALPHRLPSPEEKAKAAASQVFPAEVVRLDVTGSGFQRMTQFRRSLQHFEYVDPSAVGAAGSNGSGGAERAVRSRKRSKKKSTKKRRNTIACDGDRNDIQDALRAANNSNLSRNDGEKSGSRSSLRQRLNLVHLLRTSLMTTPSTGSKGASAGSALTSSDMSYDESDTNTQSINNTTTDATSHASSELVVQVTAGNLVTATRTRSGAMMNTISRLRRLGTDHTFASGLPAAIQVDIHPPPSSSTNGPSGDSKRVESNDGDSDLYELIPSEKEFGTLGNARPVLRGVKLRGNKENKEDGRSSSGNWSASGSSCSTRASLDSDHPRHHHHHNHPVAVSPLAQRHPRVIQHPQTARSFSPEMDVDSALSGDDCSATTTSSIHRADENGHNHNELDLETSSVYSCDAEGYYTSFHIDSGLKTLKEGQSDGSLHKNRPPVNAKEASGSDRSSGMSSASGSISGGLSSQPFPAATPENEYELFGKGSTLSSATTSSAGTVIFRPDGVGNNSNNNTVGSRKKRNSQPPEPPPRNGSSSNRNSVDSEKLRKQNPEEKKSLSQLVTETESKEIADALKQLRNNESGNEIAGSPESECMRANLTQIERIPAMCVITPSITPLPSDDDAMLNDPSGRNSGVTLESHIQSAFLQQVAATEARPSPVSRTRVNVADLPAAIPASTESTPIVIKASVVKCPVDQELVALNQLPTADPDTLNAQPFSSAGSSESSRSSSLERKKRGARVTLDSDGKVVYSSDSLKRRKAQAGHTSTFVEPGTGQNVERKLDPGTSAFRPNPIGSTGAAAGNANKPLSPPPYRPAPSFNGPRNSSSSTIPAVRTQPDGQSSTNGSGSGIPTTLVSRSDSYRLANVDDQVDSGGDPAGAFQRNRSDSYRKANQTLSVAPQAVGSHNGRLAPLSHTLSGFAVNGGTTHRSVTAAGTGQFISGHLTDRPNNNGWSSRPSQPMNYSIKSPMLVKQISNPGFNAAGQASGSAAANGRPSKQFSNRQISSPAMMMMTSSPLLVKPNNNGGGINNPNVAGRRIYGGPRLLVNPKILTSPTHQNNNNNKSGSVSSLNSSGGSGLDISMTSQQQTHHKKSAFASGFGGGVPPSPVVRPPTNAKDRPSFFNNTPDGAGTSSRLNGVSSSSSSPLPGYQSLSPPPRMSALPLAQLSTSASAEFQRKDFRYNSLPARFKTVADYYASMTGPRSSVEPNYNQWLPSAGDEKRNSSTLPSPSKLAANAARNGRDSPEEGGFLEFSPKRSNSFSSTTPSATGRVQQQGKSSPTPSYSSCSLDGSFSTSSLNESVDTRPGIWPHHPGDAAGASSSPQQPKIHSIGLVKRTTISDFKRKLLQQLHHPASNKKISAVEQLKATQPPPAGISKGPVSPDVSPVTKHPALENLIRRSARVSYIASRLSHQQQQRNNRFHPHYSPRTDVLSSTIAEGRSEEELAAADDDTVTISSVSSNGASVRRHLSFQNSSRRGSSTPSSGSSTPIETSL